MYKGITDIEYYSYMDRNPIRQHRTHAQPHETCPGTRKGLASKYVSCNNDPNKVALLGRTKTSHGSGPVAACYLAVGICCHTQAYSIKVYDDDLVPKNVLI